MVVAAAGGEAISVVVLGALGEIKSTGSEVVGATGGNTSGVETVVDEVGKAGGGSSVVGSEAAKSLVVCTSTGNGLVSGKGCVAEGEDVSCVEVGAATGGGTSTGSDD